MKVRAITDKWDWTFGRGLQDYNQNQNTIAQNVKTRLMSFYGDCFFDEGAGIDWWNLLGHGTQELLLMNIRQCIISTEGVTGINSVDLVVDREHRSFTVTYNISTVYSQNYLDQVTVGQ